MNKCPFCSIAAKESQTNIILETDHFLCFPPLTQESPNHTIIASKQHFINLIDASPIIGAPLIEVCQLLLGKYKESGYSGFNLLNANGVDAQQSVMHLHFHFIPRRNADGIDAWPDLAKSSGTSG